MGFLPHVQLAEAVEPEGHKLGADFGLRQLLTGNAGFKFLLCGLQFLQPPLGGLGKDSLLDGVQQVLDGDIRFP